MNALVLKLFVFYLILALGLMKKNLQAVEWLLKNLNLYSSIHTSFLTVNGCLVQIFTHTQRKTEGLDCPSTLHNIEFALQLTVQKAWATADKVGVRSLTNNSAMKKRTGNNFGREKEGKLTYCEDTETEADRIIHGKTKTVMFLHSVEHNVVNKPRKH